MSRLARSPIRTPPYRLRWRNIGRHATALCLPALLGPGNNLLNHFFRPFACFVGRQLAASKAYSRPRWLPRAFKLLFSSPLAVCIAVVPHCGKAETLASAPPAQPSAPTGNKATLSEVASPPPIQAAGKPRSNPDHPQEGEKWLTPEEALRLALPVCTKGLPTGKLMAVSTRGIVHAGMEDEAMRAGVHAASGRARMWVIDWCVPDRPKCIRVDVADGEVNDLLMDNIDHAKFKPLPKEDVRANQLAACVRNNLDSQLSEAAKAGQITMTGTAGNREIKPKDSPAFAAADMSLVAIAAADKATHGKGAWILAFAPPPDSESGDTFMAFACLAATGQVVKE